LVLCRDFTIDQDLFKTWLTVQQSQGLRNLQIHRVRRASTSENESSFKPRKLQVSMSEVVVRSEMTLDFLFLLDLTGSMQSYIDAARKYLIEIIQEVKSTTGVKDVRFAFVGYRDYCDRSNKAQPRFVVHDFTLNHEEIISIIQTQRASGGGDHPEDMLGGLVKALDLSWQSPIRMMAIVTDAPQHGFTGESHGDDHPDGRCPDQQAPHPSFPEAMERLANVYSVDTMFVRCSSTDATEKAIASVYPNEEGFGVLKMTSGANKLKTVLCDGLSNALNYLFSPPDQEGISTLEGNTLSALVSSACHSLRQSIKEQFPAAIAIPSTPLDDTSSAVVKKEAEKKMESVKEEEDDELAKMEDISMEVDDTDDDDDDDEVAESKKDDFREEDHDLLPAAETRRITDFESLLQNLQHDFLSLAREALGISIEEIASMKNGGNMGMLVEEDNVSKIAKSLLAEGATTKELLEEQAPIHVVGKFVEEVKSRVERI